MGGLMGGDVICQGCDALCDRTELGECVNGVYVTCHFCETEDETEARENREEAETRARMQRVADMMGGAV